MHDKLIVVDSLSISTPSKPLLKEHLKFLGLGGKKVYFITGADQSDINLVTIVDQFVKKGKTSGLPEGEKELMVTHARYAVY